MYSNTWKRSKISRISFLQYLLLWRRRKRNSVTMKIGINTTQPVSTNLPYIHANTQYITHTNTINSKYWNIWQVDTNATQLFFLIGYTTNVRMLVFIKQQNLTISLAAVDITYCKGRSMYVQYYFTRSSHSWYCWMLMSFIFLRKCL